MKRKTLLIFPWKKEVREGGGETCEISRVIGEQMPEGKSRDGPEERKSRKGSLPQGRKERYSLLLLREGFMGKGSTFI